MAIWVWYCCKGKGTDVYLAYATCQVVLSTFTHYISSFQKSYKLGAVILILQKKKPSL